MSIPTHIDDYSRQYHWRSWPIALDALPKIDGQTVCKRTRNIAWFFGGGPGWRAGPRGRVRDLWMFDPQSIEAFRPFLNWGNLHATGHTSNIREVIRLIDKHTGGTPPATHQLVESGWGYATISVGSI